MAKSRAVRGATLNMESQRFNQIERHADGDWRDLSALVDGERAPVQTRVTVEQPKSILTRNQSPDVPFDRSVNPYRGCEHGCIYCFARPTHAYHDLSPGIDFETRLFAKPNAPELLRNALAKRSYICRPIAFGTNTDPYQPIEKDWRIMRQCLEVLHAANHPLTITTKSSRVVRDIDLLSDMAQRNLVAVMISVTSLDPKIAMTLEPRAPHPEQRLKAVKALSDAGIPTLVSISPVIPAITDMGMEAIMERAASAGARAVNFIPVRLPYEVAPLFRAWLETHFPDRAGKVMSIINSLRSGRDNDSRFFERMKGTGPWAELFRTRFHLAARRYGLAASERLELRTDLFRPPAGAQGELF